MSDDPGRDPAEVCQHCDHLWRNHDPQDGKCDHPNGVGVCPCGRDIAFWQASNAARSRATLSARAGAGASEPSDAAEVATARCEAALSIVEGGPGVARQVVCALAPGHAGNHVHLGDGYAWCGDANAGAAPAEPREAEGGDRFHCATCEDDGGPCSTCRPAEKQEADDHKERLEMYRAYPPHQKDCRCGYCERAAERDAASGDTGASHE